MSINASHLYGLYVRGFRRKHEISVDVSAGSLRLLSGRNISKISVVCEAHGSVSSFACWTGGSASAEDSPWRSAGAFWSEV